MEEDVKQALINDLVVDITTTGRKTGQSCRIEIWVHYQDGTVFISGTPGKRDWYANMVAHPEFTLHLKQTLQKDIPVRAVPVTDQSRHREVFARMVELEPRRESLRANPDEWLKGAPLVEVELLG